MKEKILDIAGQILCFLGFHHVDVTYGIYQVGVCKRCGKESMYF